MAKKLTAQDLTDQQLRAAATSPISTKQMREDAEAEQAKRQAESNED